MCNERTTKLKTLSMLAAVPEARWEDERRFERAGKGASEWGANSSGRGAQTPPRSTARRHGGYISDGMPSPIATEQYRAPRSGSADTPAAAAAYGQRMTPGAQSVAAGGRSPNGGVTLIDIDSQHRRQMQQSGRMDEPGGAFSAPATTGENYTTYSGMAGTEDASQRLQFVGTGGHMAHRRGLGGEPYQRGGAGLTSALNESKNIVSSVVQALSPKRKPAGMRRVQSASVLDEDDVVIDAGQWAKSSLKVGVLIFMWFGFSSLSNNLSKSILQQLPSAMTLTISQFFFISMFCHVMVYGLGYDADPLTWALVKRAAPLTLGNAFAHWLTALSLGMVSVSFTHTIKASSPIYTVILSRIFLKEKFTTPVVLSLFPIMFGVVLCTATEVSYSKLGFCTSLCSTLVFCMQNIYSKKLFQQKVHHITLLMCTSTVSMCVCLPYFLISEVPYIMTLPGLHSDYIFVKFLAMGFCHFMQNISAFTVLSFVSPLSYSIGNTIKRIFVIVISILWFGNYVSLWNAAGIATAMFGVGCYNAARFEAKKRKLAETRDFGV